jgi:hypothetical protein
MRLLKEATMSTSKKLWLGVVVLAAVALLGPTTVYAQRQRAAAEAQAARAQQVAAEAARWNAMAEWYKNHPSAAAEDLSAAPEAVYDATGANVNMLRPEPAPKPEAGLHFTSVDSATASRLAAEHPWTDSQPAAPEPNWYDARQQQFAGPSAVSTSPVPTLVPQGP